MKFKFLGTSDSAGIPVHNCKCAACLSYRNEKKINLATCAVLEYENKVILFDAGIENIANMYDGKKIEAVFMTHFHPDHALGLLRLRYSNDEITCFHPKDTAGFSDLFKHKKSIKYIENEPLKTILIDDIKIIPIPLIHSKNTTGYIIETAHHKIAYLTDCAGITEKYMKILQRYDFDYVFLDACFTPPNIGNHLNYENATKLLDTLNTQDAYLMHQGHDTLSYILNNNINLKYRYINAFEEFVLN